MDKIILAKLNFTKCLACIEDLDIIGAVKQYENYFNSIKIYKFKKDVKKELVLSQKLFSEKLMELGSKLFDEKKFSQASIAYYSAFKYNSDNIKCIKKYIDYLEKTNQNNLILQLLKHLEKTLKSDIVNAENYLYISRKYEKLELYSNAVKFMNKYIALKKKTLITAEDYNNLGCIYDKYYSNTSFKFSDAKKSLEAFEKASNMEPDVKLYAKNAVIMAGKLKNQVLESKYWDRLLKINRMKNQDKFDYAWYCLRTNNYEGYWENFDYRFFLESNKKAYLPKIEKPKWDGKQDLSNSTLLVYCDEGFGDSITMWGYMPRLKKLAKNIVFVAQNELYGLLENNDYNIKVYRRTNLKYEEINFDYYLPSMSIPIALRLKKDSFSVIGGYIKPDLKLKNEFQKKYFNNNDFKIAVSFSGNKTGKKSRDISIDTLLALDKLKNVKLYNFTKGLSDEQFYKYKNNKVINVVKYAKNFNDTAAMLSNCDIVLTTDNCILNLAGALGIKTFALFNWDYHGRWYDLSGEDAGWYKCAKPYICKSLNDWKSAVKPAIDDIKKYITLSF